jgi:mannose-6-phosphate isomerase-like protein (cupin superfamily)
MKRYRSREAEKDCRICGPFNGSPWSVARAVTKKVLASEKLHSHDTCELYFFLKGSAKMQVNSRNITVNERDVVLVEPGEKHMISHVFEEIDYITIKSRPHFKRIF